jgi:hypothetical protein
LQIVRKRGSLFVEGGIFGRMPDTPDLKPGDGFRNAHSVTALFRAQSFPASRKYRRMAGFIFLGFSHPSLERLANIY